MKALRNYLNTIKPNFEKGGKLAMFHSVFEGFETFLFVPNHTSKSGVHIHDSVDSKRTMTVVILALLPALLFGMYNIGYQHNLAIGTDPGFIMTFVFGFLAVLPKIIVSYVVGLGIEFAIAQVKGHEIQEGFLVSGILIPLIVPIDTPLWMIAVATAFAVVFAKEVFGGTGYNIFNVALVTRAFLFFAYPAAMSGDKVFVRTGDTFGLGSGNVVDAFSGATPLGQIATSTTAEPHMTDILGNAISSMDMFIGLIPGSIGETSTLAILIGAAILIFTGIGSWKTMLSVFVGGGAMAALFNVFGTTAAMNVSPLDHLLLGGFAFGAVFMATDPVTSARTETGKYIYGFLIGVMAIFIRVLNPGYPEGMMLAILLLNAFAPLIDFYVVDSNVKRRLKRAIK
ncbi:NADH:ubiquinone reductase (Na(+)-transporting) subunit B [Macellibacteroides fermentans]|uniref:Na(+)-translocating NADH-quinone reductase subunit B n=2 Tax=root TaxID=1 RepID=A0A1T5C5B8_9BACT|nr:NADH:ubiquinone reductase (Na(+)-transporting) subunit B [Parabacteroides chartae]MDT3369148.1 NADH:ubiquinone reductase (Na(+)-transporting) subunit B [Bacteroidota bacterium]MEA4808824.1 NADH:ubiquinone reductase (Na(+)-transporting) subunit B [Macellibacteroides fermentans]HAD02096.1 NADH:ubiquinone reductase (Na(+)-transporting) subunit B [Porphyromonadaceae bacterium]SKB54624.1 Na+-transporting NADH:ubiquinone oxidoreductase subunit B [Parabacteroides chartae]HML70625.1 NADH:ubiquinone